MLTSNDSPVASFPILSHFYFLSASSTFYQLLLLLFLSESLEKSCRTFFAKTFFELILWHFTVHLTFFLHHPALWRALIEHFNQSSSLKNAPPSRPLPKHHIWPHALTLYRYFIYYTVDSIVRSKKILLLFFLSGWAVMYSHCFQLSISRIIAIIVEIWDHKRSYDELALCSELSKLALLSVLVVISASISIHALKHSIYLAAHYYRFRQLPRQRHSKKFTLHFSSHPSNGAALWPKFLEKKIFFTFLMFSLFQTECFFLSHLWHSPWAFLIISILLGLGWLLFYNIFFYLSSGTSVLTPLTLNAFNLLQNGPLCPPLKWLDCCHSRAGGSMLNFNNHQLKSCFK